MWAVKHLAGHREHGLKHGGSGLSLQGLSFSSGFTFIPGQCQLHRDASKVPASFPILMANGDSCPEEIHTNQWSSMGVIVDLIINLSIMPWSRKSRHQPGTMGNPEHGSNRGGRPKP
jgi:hypothetical protein